MFGKLLSSAVKVVTLPVDVAESIADVACGGDGSKESKKSLDSPVSEIRDAICEGLEDIDG
jgi:hypothetical protein